MKPFKAVIAATLFLIAFRPPLEARVSLLSPWAFQERLATRMNKFDQSVNFQNGWNGVTPSGDDLDSSHILFPYQISYGVLDKLEAGASWGLQHVGRKNNSNQFGINDLVVAAKYRFFDADRSQRSPGLDAEIGFSFPTASYDKGLGTGGFGVIFGWGLVLPLDPVRMQVGMGYRLNTENSDDVRIGNVFSFNVGGSYPLKQVHKDLSLIGEIKGFNRSRTKFKRTDTEGPSVDELYLAPGASFNLPKGMRALGQLMIGLTTDASDAGFSLELQF